MVKYMKKYCKDVFQKIDINPSTHKISFILQKNISSIRLTNGLNFVLGFQNVSFYPGNLRESKRPTYVAEFRPQLKRGIMNMYIYASICRPIYVGHTMVPLLKNVFIDSSKDADTEGHARNYVVYNPMYIPISTTSFSQIEINIRNDAGQLVSFPHGAITCLTLHFRKHQRGG